MEEALRTRLLAYSGLTAIVGNRVWWIERPQGTDLPAVTLQLISPGRTYTHDGATGPAGSRVQFDTWGYQYAAAKLAVRQIIAVMESPATVGDIRFGPSFLDAERDLPVTDLPGGKKAFRTSFDMIVWWQLSA